MKKIALILVALLMTFACIAIAEDEPTVYTSGNFEYILLDNGTAEIKSYIGEQRTTRIPEKLDGYLVTSIGDSAFYHTRLTKITIPDSVTYIGNYAFKYCDLTEITIPDSVTYIGESAFHSCNFTKITIPDSVTSISNAAFEECRSLSKITLSDSVLSIGDYAFNCCALTECTIPNSVTSIGEGAFARCNSLKQITIPNTATSIGNNPFLFCSKLTKIIVSPDHPTLATIDGVLFDKTEKKLICYPFAFSAKSYSVPQGISSIGSYAFAGTHLTEITIPNSVTSIGINPFELSAGLTKIKVSSDNPTLETIDGVLFDKAEKKLICFPYAFSAKSYSVPQGISSIGDEAFSCCDSLTEIKLPDSITYIGDYAFYQCYLKKINLPDSITYIGDSAFDRCSLTEITIPDSVTYIGVSAFIDCDFTEITIPNGVTSIGDYAFSYCSSLTSITIPDSVTSIGNEAFSSCSSLTSITIPDSVTSIGEDAFDGCDQLTLTVKRNSYAQQYAQENNISYTYPDSLDWLNS